MTPEQARQILMACRPGTQDSQDPAVAEALEMVRHDPSLELWLKQQEAFNESLRARLRGIEVPPDLKERILARRKVIVPLWRRPVFLLAAACVAAAFVIAALWSTSRPSEDETFAGFRSRMVGFALRVYRMDIITNDPGQVREFLRSRGAPADFALTPGLLATPVKGGAKLSWQGHPVSMVCFHLQTNQTLYMFVMNQSAIPNGNPPGPTPVLAEVGGIMTASWSWEGRVYVVAAATSPTELERLVVPAGTAARLQEPLWGAYKEVCSGGPSFCGSALVGDRAPAQDVVSRTLFVIPQESLTTLGERDRFRRLPS